jgi:nucleotide sugar dehydrogenase
MKIVVVALGKIGLPLAVQFAERGHDVMGADVNASVVAQVNAGREPFPGEAHLAEKLIAVVNHGRLKATTDTTSAVAQADVVVVVVPLFVDNDGAPKFGWLDSATRDIGEGLRPGTLVCFETTLPVGTTRNRWKPLLERESGLREGTDFHVVFSPERVLTGRLFADLRKYPKLIGGLSDDGAKRGMAFYEEVLDFDDRPDLTRGNGVWDLGSAEAAELAKLAETTYRDVNIGLANQFACFAQNNCIDIYEVIQAANSQPFSHIHQPGISVGGHCIPIYPQLYLFNDPSASIVEAARKANADMPSHCVDLLEQLFGDVRGAIVVVLGAAYRKGVKETAFSGVFPTVERLAALGADCRVHDPLYSPRELEALGFRPHALGEPADAAILHTNHDSYAFLSEEDFPGIRVMIDGRNAIDPARWLKALLRRLGASPRSPG